MTKELTTTENDLSTLLARANELLNNPEEEYNVREFVKHSRLFTIHDYKEMGERPVSTYDCGSARLKDTPKVLYRALFLFAPEHVSFKKMYKEDPMTCVAVAPDLATEGAYCVCCGKPERVPDAEWLRLAGRRLDAARDARKGERPTERV